MITITKDEPVIFEKASWVRKGEGFYAVPGTWDDASTWEEGRPEWLLGLFACPACGKTCALHNRVHKVDQFGKVSLKSGGTHIECKHDGCSFSRQVFLDEWNKKPLYAVAVEVYKRDGTIEPQIHHCHAKDEREARFHLGRGNYRIVAVARAIGYHVLDTKGKVLRA